MSWNNVIRISTVKGHESWTAIKEMRLYERSYFNTFFKVKYTQGIEIFIRFH